MKQIVSWLEGTLTDLRFGWRRICAHPGRSLLIVAILALGIGANTAVFSLVNTVLLKPLPYPDSERLAMLWEVHPDLDARQGASPGNMLDWRRENDVFEGMGAWYAEQAKTIQGESVAEKVTTARAAGDFFQVAGVPALLGRFFDAQEVERQAAVVVLSHGLWLRRFGADRDVVGRDLVLDGEPYRVIGIMPPQFALPNKDVDLWLPWNFQIGYSNLPSVPRDQRFLRTLARLKPGVSLREAQQNLDAVAAQLRRYPQNRGWEVQVTSFQGEILGNVRRPLWILLGAVGLVLLIACANLASLQMAGAAARRREMAVRAAVGASRAQLLRQFLMEASILAGLGGLAALLAARAAPVALSAGKFLPRADEAAVDGRVVAFTALTSLLTVMLFALLPALQVVGRDLTSRGLRETGWSSSGQSGRITAWLVVAEVALAVTLLMGAGLLVRSLINLFDVDPGFDADRLLVMRVFPDSAKYPTIEKRLQYFDRLTTELESLPGVVSVGAATGLPWNGFNNTPMFPFWPAEMPRPTSGGLEALTTMATTGYFRTMRMKLLAGREFDGRDRSGAPLVVIVNQTLARIAWPGEDPIGKRLTLDYSNRGLQTFEVVGMAGDLRTAALKLDPQPEIFRPHAQAPYVTMNVVVRTESDPLALSQAARQVVLDLDPSQPVHSVTTMESLLSDSTARDRFAAQLLSALAALALILAGSGIYAVLSTNVRGRTRELAIRMALGATGRDILALVTSHAGRLLGFGMAIGLLLSLLFTRTLRTLLFGVGPLDWRAAGAALLLLALAGFSAALLPALRAVSIDGVRALRIDE